MATYSKAFKEKLIKKMLPPENKKVKDLVKEYKIHEQTLYKWRRKAKSNGIVYQDGKKSKEKYSKKMQLQIIIETSGMNNQEISEYCRRKGLYVEEIEAWKKSIINGETDKEKKIKSELKIKDSELKKVKKELNRKEKALAEAAALLILEKKIQAIWDSDEEN
jgi:transposase-like protein